MNGMYFRMTLSASTLPVWTVMVDAHIGETRVVQKYVPFLNQEAYFIEISQPCCKQALLNVY